MGVSASKQDTIILNHQRNAEEGKRIYLYQHGNLYYDDDEKTCDMEGSKCQRCAASFLSMPLFCPNRHSLVSPKLKKQMKFGSPLPDTPEEVRRKRKLLEGLLEVEESAHHLNYALTSCLAKIHEGQDGELELTRKYKIGEELGVGSTSTCHRCIDRTTGIEYACKIIDKIHVESLWEGMMDQFYTEIEVLRSLHHPNIIQLYDVFYTAKKIYIVMELMEGGELFDYVVQKGTLTEEEASRIVRMVTSALAYMHGQNIIHRDLKPENLLLTHKPKSESDIVVKIIDFGLSKLLYSDKSPSHEPVTSTFLGTKGYLAPEILQRRDYTRAVDAWALGVIIFVLLCGCLPFDDDTDLLPDSAVRSKFVLRFPRWAKNLSGSAKDLLSHLLDVDARMRYTPEQALKHPWILGETASRNVLLQSPGRINLKSTVGNIGLIQPPEAMKSTFRARAEAHAVQRLVPNRQLVRQTSI